MLKKVLVVVMFLSVALFQNGAKAQGYSSFGGNYGGENNQYGATNPSANANAAAMNEGASSGQKGGKIVLYYDGFKIVKTATGRVRCRVSFHIDNNSDQDISSVSAKLKWSVMKTVVNFSGVKSGETGSLKYMLLGKGCYTMTGEPEIELNRCRLKGGASQDDCADMIQWRN